MRLFQDKVAVVTGGASGIGKALSTRMASYGARVVMSDIDEPKLREAAAEIGASAVVTDVVDAEAVQSLVDQTVSEHGRIDYMFNNAGIAVIGEVIDMELDDWYRILDINLRGVVHGIHAAYPMMCAQRSGHIVNTASVAGLIAAPALGAYCATKHAVVGLSRVLRVEAKAYGVKVSVVCPGLIETSIADNARYRNIDRDRVEQNMRFKPMSADACAAEILRGVGANKREIVVTGFGRFAYRLQRFFPGVIERFAARGVQRARREQ